MKKALSRESLLANAGMSDYESSFHIICVIAGTGLLQIPYSLAQMGWSGVGLLVFLAFVNLYTSYLLIRCLTHEVLGYTDLGNRAFGKLGGFFVTFFYGTSIGGTVCLYLILAGMNFAELFGLLNQVQWMITLSAILLIPLLAVKSLKEVGILSFFGAATAFAVVALVSIGSYKDYDNNVGLNNHKFFDLRAFGSVLGTLCFSYGGNFVYPEIYHEMKHRTHFVRVLGISLALISVLYLATGVFGYRTYGDMAKSPIYMNLPEGFFRKGSIIIITSHVLFACPLLFQTICIDIERGLNIEGVKWQNLLRISVIILVCLISTTLPFFSDMMSLIGAVSNTMLIFILPVLFNFYLGEGNTTTTYILGLGIMVIGLFGGTLGTYDAVQALYHDVMRARAH